MPIRPATAKDIDRIYDIWLASVIATHTFLTLEAIEHYKPPARKYFESNDSDFFVWCPEAAFVAGFMGITKNKIEALFLDPNYMRRGGGRALVEFAKSLHTELLVDVNEQNADATRFYEACGFVVEGRSEFDETGRPHPLLHLRLASNR